MRDIEEEAVQDRRCRRVGEFLDKLGRGMGAEGLANGVLTDIRIRLATEEEPSVLLIVRGWDERGKHIAFVGAFSVIDALLAWRAKREHKGLKWREDVPWSERGGTAE